jgi:hypothetical protein
VYTMLQTERTGYSYAKLHEMASQTTLIALFPN